MLRINGKGMRQQSRADCSVWGIEHSPNGRGKTVHCTKAGVGQSKAATEAGISHVFTGVFFTAKGTAQPGYVGVSHITLGETCITLTGSKTLSTLPFPIISRDSFWNRTSN